MDAKSLLALGATARPFRFLMTDDEVWERLTLRDLSSPRSNNVPFLASLSGCNPDEFKSDVPWKKIYAGAFGKYVHSPHAIFLQYQTPNNSLFDHIFVDPSSAFKWHNSFRLFSGKDIFITAPLLYYHFQFFIMIFVYLFAR